MFKFSTNTILNCTAAQLVMSGSGDVKVSDAWRSADYNNAKLSGVADKWLAIERLGTFRKGNVTKIFRRDAVAGTAGKVVVTCTPSNTYTSYGEASPTVKGIYRLLLYIKLSGSNNSYFANDFVFKGKPLAYEFELKTTTAADLAKGLAEAIKKESRRFGSKYIKASVNGTALTVEAVGPDACYELFTQAELQKFDSEYNSALIGGEYRNLNANVVNTPCKNPFGTYWQIMKDLRLPTADALRFGAIVAEDRPALDGQYAQFIIYMCVDRGIMGGDAVGEITKSVTAHSIWVPQGVADTFATLLETYTGVTAEYHDADYKIAGAAYSDSEGTAWTAAPWNGVTTTESGETAVDEDAHDVTKGEAYAGEGKPEEVEDSGNP